MNVDGTDPQRLTEWPGYDSSPQWSADGSLIVFGHGAGAERDLWLMEASGSNLRRLTDNSYVESSPSWFSSGDQIVFVSGRSAEDFPCSEDCDAEVRMLDLTTLEITNVTDNESTESYVSLSPDEGRLAVTRNDSPTTLGDLFIVDLATNEERQIGDPNLNLWAPDWSPDGTKLVVAGQSPGTVTDSSIFILDPATGASRLFTTGPYFGSPSWSPDGTQILYSCNFRVCIMDSDGSGSRVVGEFDNVLGGLDWQPLTVGPTPTPEPTQTSSPTPSPSPAGPRKLPRTGGMPR
jgi:TolB protein